MPKLYVIIYFFMFILISCRITIIGFYTMGIVPLYDGRSLRLVLFEDHVGPRGLSFPSFSTISFKILTLMSLSHQVSTMFRLGRRRALWMLKAQATWWWKLLSTFAIGLEVKSVIKWVDDFTKVNCHVTARHGLLLPLPKDNMTPTSSRR